MKTRSQNRQNGTFKYYYNPITDDIQYHISEELYVTAWTANPDFKRSCSYFSMLQLKNPEEEIDQVAGS